MARNTNRGTLSETERLEIIERHAKGQDTYQSIATDYGVHKSTISRIIKRQNKKLEAQRKPVTAPVSTGGVVIRDPLEFRESKLAEIAHDIEQTRMRGSHHALPQFHRLHVQVHDEWTQLRRDAEDLDGVTNPDDLLHSIAIAVKGLPPVLKDRLVDMLDAEYANVIPLPVSQS